MILNNFQKTDVNNINNKSSFTYKYLGIIKL